MAVSRPLRCPICGSTLVVPRGYSRGTIACQYGHRFQVARPARRSFLLRPLPLLSLLVIAILVVLAIAAVGWPLHLGALRRFDG